MTKVIDSANDAMLQKEFLPEQQETINFYSDDSTDEYEFHDTDSIALSTKANSKQTSSESDSKYSTNIKDLILDLITTN